MCLERITAAAYGFDTTRKAAWIVDSLAETPIAGVRLLEPPQLTEPQLQAIHSIEYVNAVKTGSPRHLAESRAALDAGARRLLILDLAD